ncbi:MAG: divergent polysaccharide deacetylase family protein, partial [Betaproteobacteria bacterium]
MQRKVTLRGSLLALAAAIGLAVTGCAVPVLSRQADLTPAVDRVERAIGAALLRQGVALAEVRTGVQAETVHSRSPNARWTHRSYTIVAHPTFRQLKPSDYAAAVREGVRRAGARAREDCRLSPRGAVETVRFAVLVPVRIGRQRLTIDALAITIVPPDTPPADEGVDASPSRAEAEPESEGSPRVALIIDDWGYEQPFASEFFALPVPLTMAVLPHRPASERLAREGHERGWEVLVHLPLEPESPREAEAGMIRVAMSDGAVRRAVAEALAAVPYAVGVNNHKGSRATRDRRVVNAMLDEVSARRFFLVDSRTSPASVVGEMARERGLAYGENLLFLDGRSDPDYIRHMLRIVAQAAERNGYAIGIGHVREATLAALRAELPLLLQRGVAFVPVGQLVRPDFRYRWRRDTPPVPQPAAPAGGPAQTITVRPAGPPAEPAS